MFRLVMRWVMVVECCRIRGGLVRYRRINDFDVSGACLWNAVRLPLWHDRSVGHMASTTTTITKTATTSVPKMVDCSIHDSRCDVVRPLELRGCGCWLEQHEKKKEKRRSSTRHGQHQVAHAHPGCEYQT